MLVCHSQYLAQSALETYFGTIPRSKPSMTADPNGRVELDPPPKRFQRVVAKVVACDELEKPYVPTDPPRLRRTILPAA